MLSSRAVWVSERHRSRPPARGPWRYNESFEYWMISGLSRGNFAARRVGGREQNSVEHFCGRRGDRGPLNTGTLSDARCITSGCFGEDMMPLAGFSNRVGPVGELALAGMAI